MGSGQSVHQGHSNTGSVELLTACASGNIEWLLQHEPTSDSGARSLAHVLNNSHDQNKMYPLHLACESNRHQVVELLLKYGADMNVLTVRGNTPLHIASRTGSVGTVK
jgi:ankyrin repeat protein